MKKNNLKYFIAFIFTNALLLCFQGHSSELKLELKEVLESTQKNYPKILALYQEIEAAKGSILEAEGFFDVKLRQNFLDKSRGYYDGKEINTEISKKNQFLGSEIYGGYRKSFGDFENHESGLYTNHDGEFRVGAKFSLLQNSMIDENRLRLMLSRLNLEESKLALKNIKNEIRRDAAKAYYNWIVYGEIYKINKELYELALARNKQFEVRVAKGDLAAIVLIENERNALSRKTAMIKALQDFENSALYLSLFYRDDKGEPIIVKTEMCPYLKNTTHLKKIDVSHFEKDLIHALQNRADIALIKISKQKEQNNLKQAQNLYKPKLDVDFSASNDISNENKARGQSKNEVNVKFEIPLQQRTAKGKTTQARAKIDKIIYEEKLLQESAKMRLSQIKNSLNSITEINDNLQQEIALSLKLENAEKIRFEKGGGDFFLINLREQSTALAKISAALAFGEYFKTHAEYEAEAFLAH